MQCLLIFLLSPVRTALCSPVFEGGEDRQCQTCPAGTYQSACAECTACPPGSYMTGFNQEKKCRRCFADCRPDFNLKVVGNCTSTSDVRCACKAGFTCTIKVSLSDNCRYCKRIQETTTAATSPQDSSTSAKSNCPFPRCATRAVVLPGNATHSQIENDIPQAAIVVSLLIFMGSATLVTLFSICRPANKLSFKQALLLCTKGGRDSTLKSKESTHQAPRDSSSAKQPPSSSLSAANLGPVHFHNPGTVIFSLLSQFTGQVGPTVEAERRTAETDKYEVEEEEERDCPVFHPTSSPSIHLSEEERSSESDSIFFPCQEQGKDCHVSKEEAL